MECNQKEPSKEMFPMDKKPIKLLFEVYLNQKKNIFNGTVQMSEPEDFKLLEVPKDTTMEIQIKLNIPHSNDEFNHIFSNDITKYEDIVDLQSTKTNETFSEVILLQNNPIKKEEVEKTKREVYSSKASIQVNLSVQECDKMNENQQETLFFDVHTHLEQKKSKTLPSFTISELDGSDLSLWKKIFEKIQKNYRTSCDDNIVNIIHELIMEKYKHALSKIKKRIEKRELTKHLNIMTSTILDDSNCEEQDLKTSFERPSKVFFSQENINDETTFIGFHSKRKSQEKCKSSATLFESPNSFDQKLNSWTVLDYHKNFDEILNASRITLNTKNEIMVESMEDFNNAKNYSMNISNFRPLQTSGFYAAKIEADVHINDYKNKDMEFLKSEGASMLQEINTILDSKTNISKSVEEIEYDERTFLNNALGEELWNCSSNSESEYETHLYDTPLIETLPTFKIGQSVGSSDISLLISNSCNRNSAGIESLYSVVDKNAKMKYRNKEGLWAKSTKSSNDYGYESLDDLDSNHLENNFMTKKVILNETLLQISNAVQLCRNQSTIFGTEILVEAEKILLVASLRKIAYEEELKKQEYEEIGRQLTSCSVTVNNIELFSKPNSFVKNKRYEWHYLLVFRLGSVVYPSTTLTSKISDQGTLSFPDKIYFDGVPSDFNLDISIYGLMLKNKKDKKGKAKSSKILKMIPSSSFNIARPYFILWGITTITASQSNQTIFNLSQVPPEAPIADILKINLETSFRIHIKMAGFLTVGVEYRGHPLWNRRWCSLNGSRLRYWNHPNEEGHCEPLKELDLLHCASYEVQRAHRDICPTSRTLLLEMSYNENDKNIKKRYFLCADNLNDFNKWQENLNSVLGYLRNWSTYNCYLEN